MCQSISHVFIVLEMCNCASRTYIHTSKHSDKQLCDVYVLVCMCAWARNAFHGCKKTSPASNWGWSPPSAAAAPPPWWWTSAASGCPVRPLLETAGGCLPSLLPFKIFCTSWAWNHVCIHLRPNSSSENHHSFHYISHHCQTCQNYFNKKELLKDRNILISK